MWMRLWRTWKLLFTDTWTSACHSEQFASHRVILCGWHPFSSPWWGLNLGLVKTGGDRLQEINRRISEVISENRRNLLQAPVGAREWWKHVDSLSQRRCSSAKVTLDMQSLAELNDYFAELCWDSAYKQPTTAQVESGVQVPEISERQIWNCLQHPKKTATGPDLIPFWVWRDYAEIFTPLICKIWNLSLRFSTWPSS